MGNVTSRVTNTVTRPVREYNLYERAHKAVIKNKYVPSPKHPSTQEFIEKTINELPSDVKQKLTNADVSLEERLRQVYVTSQDIVPIQTQSGQHPDRSLPLDRAHHEVPEYGFFEPKVVPYGKVTLKDAVQFISAHQTDPDNYSSDSIAVKHKLDQRLTEQVLKHFGTFSLYVPPQPTAKQQEMLKQLQATPKAIPSTTDLKHRLHGVAMSNTSDNPVSLPLQQFPEPVPKTLEATLWNPSGTGESSPTDDGITDHGMAPFFEQHIVNDSRADASALEDASKEHLEKLSSADAMAEEGLVSRQSSDYVVTQTKSDEKNKNADAT